MYVVSFLLRPPVSFASIYSRRVLNDEGKLGSLDSLCNPPQTPIRLRSLVTVTTDCTSEQMLQVAVLVLQHH